MTLGTGAPPGPDFVLPPGVKLRVHQQESLAALGRAWAQGRTRAWVALAPGAGKTLVGLEAASTSAPTVSSRTPRPH